MLYDCHSIRSVIPRLFDGELPDFNIGTNDGASLRPGACTRGDRSGLRREPASATSSTAASRAAGSPATTASPTSGVHAVQMELACRGYMREPAGPVEPDNWPAAYDPDYAAPMRADADATSSKPACASPRLRTEDPA